MDVEVGTLLRLKIPFHGNKKGDLGVCYDVCEHINACIILQNGFYNIFSPREQEDYFELVSHNKDFNYKFINVIKLQTDYESGLFFQQQRGR